MTMKRVMLMKRVMTILVKVKTMIVSLTQERREDMLSRETPTTYNIIKHPEKKQTHRFNTILTSSIK